MKYWLRELFRFFKQRKHKNVENFKRVKGEDFVRKIRPPIVLDPDND